MKDIKLGRHVLDLLLSAASVGRVRISRRMKPRKSRQRSRTFRHRRNVAGSARRYKLQMKNRQRQRIGTGG